MRILRRILRKLCVRKGDKSWNWITFILKYSYLFSTKVGSLMTDKDKVLEIAKRNKRLEISWDTKIPKQRLKFINTWPKICEKIRKKIWRKSILAHVFWTDNEGFVKFGRAFLYYDKRILVPTVHHIIYENKEIEMLY